MRDLTKLCCSSIAFLLGGTAAGASAHEIDTRWQAILADYLKIQDALSADATTGVKEAARDVVVKAERIEMRDLSGEHAEHYADLPAKITKAAEQLAIASSIEAAREAFKELSRPMARWASVAKPKGVDVVFCSMVNASWLQKHGDIRNPYYGKAMLGCGEIVGGEKHETTSGQHHAH